MTHSDLLQWAARHGISEAALADLSATLAGQCAPPVHRGRAVELNEAGVQRLVRLEAARAGVLLFRNNVGALLDARGVPVRYGLANESARQNAAIKSADLIGIRPVLIGPQHIGQTIGQFVSREIKAPGWRYSGTGREPAQQAWAALIASKGGDACFASGEGTFGA